VGWAGSCANCDLKRPENRYLVLVKKLEKAFHHVSKETHARICLDVPLKRPQPVALSLLADRCLIPDTVFDSVAEPPEYDPYRHMVSRPVPKRPYRIDASAISTDISLQNKGSTVAVKIGIHISMSPYPAASASFFKTTGRPRKRILASKDNNLLDAKHEKK
jgi:hypothetical protein